MDISNQLGIGLINGSMGAGDRKDLSEISMDNYISYDDGEIIPSDNPNVMSSTKYDLMYNQEHMNSLMTIPKDSERQEAKAKFELKMFECKNAFEESMKCSADWDKTHVAYKLCSMIDPSHLISTFSYKEIIVAISHTFLAYNANEGRFLIEWLYGREGMQVDIDGWRENTLEQALNLYRKENNRWSFITLCHYAKISDPDMYQMTMNKWAEPIAIDIITSDEKPRHEQIAMLIYIHNLTKFMLKRITPNKSEWYAVNKGYLNVVNQSWVSEFIISRTKANMTWPAPGSKGSIFVIPSRSNPSNVIDNTRLAGCSTDDRGRSSGTPSEILMWSNQLEHVRSMCSGVTDFKNIVGILGRLMSPTCDNIDETLNSNKFATGWENCITYANGTGINIYPECKLEDYITKHGCELKICCNMPTDDPRRAQLYERAKELGLICTTRYDIKVHKELLTWLTQLFTGTLYKYIVTDLAALLCGMQFSKKVRFGIGGGDNGKSMFIRLVEDTLKSYAVTVTSNVFQSDGGNGPSPEKMQMAYSRFVSSSEIGGKKLNAEAVKDKSGDDRMYARGCGSDGFSFEPTFLQWLTGNSLPIIDGADEATFKRLMPIPFYACWTTDVQSMKRSILRDYRIKLNRVGCEFGCINTIDKYDTMMSNEERPEARDELIRRRDVILSEIGCAKGCMNIAKECDLKTKFVFSKDDTFKEKIPSMAPYFAGMLVMDYYKFIDDIKVENRFKHDLLVAANEGARIQVSPVLNWLDANVIITGGDSSVMLSELMTKYGYHSTKHKLSSVSKIAMSNNIKWFIAAKNANHAVDIADGEYRGMSMLSSSRLDGGLS